MLALAPAPRVSSADTISLTWNDCPLGSTAASDLAFGCGGPAGDASLFCSFSLAAPVDSVIGVEVVVDLQHADPTLPSWWHFEPGGCRDDQLRADARFLTQCLNPWPNGASGGVVSYAVTQPRGGMNQSRTVVALSVPPFEAASLLAGQTYYAARIRLPFDQTSTCAGCGGAACLVLNSVRLLRPPRPQGAPSGDVVLEPPAAGVAHATWQGGAGAGCDLVPVRRSSWGSIKSLYR